MNPYFNNHFMYPNPQMQYNYPHAMYQKGQSQMPSIDAMYTTVHPYDNQQFLLKTFGNKPDYIRVFLTLSHQDKLTMCMLMQQKKLYGEIKDKDSYQRILKEIAQKVHNYNLFYKPQSQKQNKQQQKSKQLEDKIDDIVEKTFEKLKMSNLTYSEGVKKKGHQEEVVLTESDQEQWVQSQVGQASSPKKQLKGGNYLKQLKENEEKRVRQIDQKKPVFNMFTFDSQMEEAMTHQIGLKTIAQIQKKSIWQLQVQDQQVQEQEPNLKQIFKSKNTQKCDINEEKGINEVKGQSNSILFEYENMNNNNFAANNVNQPIESSAGINTYSIDANQNYNTLLFNQNYFDANKQTLQMQQISSKSTKVISNSVNETINEIQQENDNQDMLTVNASIQEGVVKQYKEDEEEFIQEIPQAMESSPNSIHAQHNFQLQQKIEEVQQKDQKPEDNIKQQQQKDQKPEDNIKEQQQKVELKEINSCIQGDLFDVNDVMMSQSIPTTQNIQFDAQLLIGPVHTHSTHDNNQNYPSTNNLGHQKCQISIVHQLQTNPVEQYSLGGEQFSFQTNEILNMQGQSMRNSTYFFNNNETECVLQSLKVQLNPKEKELIMKQLKKKSFECNIQFYQIMMSYLHQISLNTSAQFNHLNQQYIIVKEIHEETQRYTSAVEEDQQEKVSMSIKRSKELLRIVYDNSNKTEHYVNALLNNSSKEKGFLYKFGKVLVDCISPKIISKVVSQQNKSQILNSFYVIYTLEKLNALQKLKNNTEKLISFANAEYQKFRELNPQIQQQIESQPNKYPKYVSYIKGFVRILWICERMITLLKICCIKSSSNMVRTLRICKDMKAKYAAFDVQERSILLPQKYKEVMKTGIERNKGLYDLHSDFLEVYEQIPICSVCLLEVERKGAKIANEYYHYSCFNLLGQLDKQANSFQD